MKDSTRSASCIQHVHFECCTFVTRERFTTCPSHAATVRPQRMPLSLCGVDHVSDILHHRHIWSLRGHIVLSCHIAGFTSFTSPSRSYSGANDVGSSSGFIFLYYHPCVNTPLLRGFQPAKLCCPIYNVFRRAIKCLILRAGVCSSCKDGSHVRSCNAAP